MSVGHVPGQPAYDEAGGGVQDYDVPLRPVDLPIEDASQDARVFHTVPAAQFLDFRPGEAERRRVELMRAHHPLRDHAIMVDPQRRQLVHPAAPGRAARPWTAHARRRPSRPSTSAYFGRRLSEKIPAS